MREVAPNHEIPLAALSALRARSGVSLSTGTLNRAICASVSRPGGSVDWGEHGAPGRTSRCAASTTKSGELIASFPSAEAAIDYDEARFVLRLGGREDLAGLLHR